jgi:hypothetical protein
MAAPEDVLTASRPPADFLQATGSARDGFLLHAYEDASATTRRTERPLDTRAVTDVVTRYLADVADWDAGVAWRPAPADAPRGLRGLGLPGAIAFVIFAGAFVVALALGRAAGGPPATAADWGRGLAAIAILSLYIGWLDVFFRWLRPRAARALGARLGAPVAESLHTLDAGTWTVSGTGAGRRLLVYTLDFALLVLATVLPIAAPAIAAFLAWGRP